MAGTKNIGQVAGVHIGNTPPENIILIWYDNTPSQMRHKVYDQGLSQWVVLDQSIISLITYSELVNIAKNVGLSIGQYFQIKDKGNALALAITTTKVQYDDELGNILIDDLGTNIQYHVTSSNLLIDDVAGVFDEVNKKLVFQFNEVVPDMTADDYIMGKVQRNNVWRLAKYRLSSFLSKVTGNSISWNGGFFFNFGEALKGQLDKNGGVVAKDTYDTDMQTVNQNIQNVGKANQEIIDNANKAIENATSNEAIYSKKSPALETGGEPTDAAKGDTLFTILSKFQRYITRFKYATGIRVSTDFTDAVLPEYVNNNDTVDSALRKIQYWLKRMTYGESIKVSSIDFPILESEPSEITKDDSIMESLSKLVYFVNHINNSQLLDNIVEINNIAKTGILATDAIRITFNVINFVFDGGIGFNVVQGTDNELFKPTLYNKNPYEFSSRYNQNPEMPPILAFCPVTPVKNYSSEDNEGYYLASKLIHNVTGGATFQIIFKITDLLRNNLLNSNLLFFNYSVDIIIYGSSVYTITKTISVDYVNYITFSLPKSMFNEEKDKQNISLYVTVRATNP